MTDHGGVKPVSSPWFRSLGQKASRSGGCLTLVGIQGTSQPIFRLSQGGRGGGARPADSPT